MARYTFASKDETHEFENTVSFEAIGLGDVLDYFEQFLKGAGFELNGHITESGENG